MHRSMCARLARLAGALALAATMALPAWAQDEEQIPAWAMVLPKDGQVLVTWAAVPNATGYNVFRRAVGEELDQAKLVNAQPIKETSLVDTGLKNRIPLIYAVRAVLSDGSMGEAREAVGTPHEPILQRYQFYDIETLFPGTVTVDSNVLTIRASGADIWDGEDGQTFLATPVTGDFTITMRLLEKPVIAEDEISDFGKVGLQAKFSLIPDSPYALVFASVERTPEYMFEGRRNQGGGEGNFSGGSVDFEEAQFPVWLRLQRVGNTFTAFHSFDGTNFTRTFDPQTIQNAPEEMFVGITATAHSDGLFIVGKIDAQSVTLTTP